MKGRVLKLVVGLMAVVAVAGIVPVGTMQILEPVAYAEQKQEVFVGSARSNKYHYPWCKWAQKISPRNLVTFSSSEDAQRRGYVPCKVCNPPQ